MDFEGAVGQVESMQGYVLVGGWPGSGKTTLARALALELKIAYLAKDDVKEALMGHLGAPESVDDSRRLGRAAVAATLRVAQGCPAAVIDSTWFSHIAPLVAELSGPFVEVRCEAPLDVVRRRYADRTRDVRHLDAHRSDSELWGEQVRPLGVGPLVTVDTAGPVDIADVARRVGGHLGAGGRWATDRAQPNLPSRDLAITRSFYERFGFREQYRDHRWMILQRGSIQLEFFAHPDVDPLTSGFQCTVRVEDLDELWGAVRESGVPIGRVGHPRLHPPRLEASGLRIGYLIDPDGTQLTLIQSP